MIGVVHTDEITQNSDTILEWIKENDIRHLAIHLDLDVLDPKPFRSTLFREPEPEIDPVEAFPAGTMSFKVLARLLKDLHENTTIVGLGITEHLPWDAINLRNLLTQGPNSPVNFELRRKGSRCLRVPVTRRWQGSLLV